MMRVGSYYGTVVQPPNPASGGVWISVHTERGGVAGPYRCQFLEGPGASTSVAGLHSHEVFPELAAGDRVLVTFIAGDPDRPLILGRVTG